MKQTPRRLAAFLAAVVGASALAACGSASDGGGSDSKKVTLVTHDSFEVSEKVLEQFTQQTGYQVEVLRGGDTGTAVNQAVLSRDNPQGDVFFGVDNTLLSRALDRKLFTSYKAKGLERIPEALRLDPEHRVTPIDYGDICVNYDRGYFKKKGVEPPHTFDDLIRPEYRDLLVVENAATSSPGLGFLLGTIAEYGEDGWQDYWKKLKDNGVEVVDGWEQAYNDRFTGGGSQRGDRPLVVSYGSSPPVEVLGVEPAPKEAPTAVSTGTCFRQVEFAGLLHGAGNPEGGKALLDFLIGEEFQGDLPLKMFVYPARADVTLPELFTRYGEKIEKPATLAPQKITEGREQWIDQWTSLVLK